MRVCCVLLALLLATGRSADAAVVKDLKITVLSTMLADQGIGEWGFAALVEADGRRLLVDTGARPDTVLNNARELKIDLATVPMVVLTHFHGDHTGGLMTLRTDAKPRDAGALATVHVATGIFYPRPQSNGREGNRMIALRAPYEATGASFVEHDGFAEISPGVWVTGPVPRPNAERNWSGSGHVQTPTGVVEDTVPDDQSVVIETDRGLVILTGCGHAGIVNIVGDVTQRFPGRPVVAIIGGLHLFAASDAQVAWTARSLRKAGVRYLLGAHCTGIEAVYQLRKGLALDRHSAVVGAVGASFNVADGIHPGRLAQ